MFGGWLHPRNGSAPGGSAEFCQRLLQTAGQRSGIRDAHSRCDDAEIERAGVALQRHIETEAMFDDRHRPVGAQPGTARYSGKSGPGTFEITRLAIGGMRSASEVRPYSAAAAESSHGSPSTENQWGSRLSVRA